MPWQVEILVAGAGSALAWGLAAHGACALPSKVLPSEVLPSKSGDPAARRSCRMPVARAPLLASPRALRSSADGPEPGHGGHGLTHPRGRPLGGTCRMGAPGAPAMIVGPALQGVGVQGLRVAGASVMPAIVAGNTNAANTMIGARIGARAAALLAAGAPRTEAA
jgi:choline dehydrogenase-like flavoprotein